MVYDIVKRPTRDIFAEQLDGVKFAEQ